MKVCIVGGGNAAHAMAALFPHLGIPCNLFAPYGDEAEQIRRGIADQGHILARFAPHNDPAGEVRGRPERVSARPEEVVPGCDVVILPLPSFAYRSVFAQIGPHLDAGALVAVTPGQGGVDWVAREVLGEALARVTLCAVMPMPFNCRIEEMGRRVEVQTLKRRYRVAALPAAGEERGVGVVRSLFGHAEGAGHFLAAALYPINAVIHPARLYSLCRDWEPGTVLPRNPLFYEEMTAEAVAWMEKINAEAAATARALSRRGCTGLAVPPIHEFLARYVYRDPEPDLRAFFASNPAYRGFRCPFREVPGGWVPDFTNRYFTEDIPWGLCVYRGLAELAGVDTPAIDEILLWAQGHMGKEYLRGGRLDGRDLGESGSPQRYGIRSLDALLRCYPGEAGSSTP